MVFYIHVFLAILHQIFLTILDTKLILLHRGKNMNFKLQITELLALDQHLVQVENDGDMSVLTQASVKWEYKPSRGRCGEHLGPWS